MPVQRRVVVVLCCLATMLIAPVLAWPGSAPAGAHDQLISSTPADGASVPTATQVTLRFSASLIQVGTEVRVTGPDGSVVSTDPATVDGPTVRQALPSELAPGGYRVAWRVVSSDGHPISGVTTFTVSGTGTAGATSGPTSATASASSAASGPTASTAATVATPASPAPTGASAQDADADTGSRPLPWIGAAAVLAALAALIAARRRR